MSPEPHAVRRGSTNSRPSQQMSVRQDRNNKKLLQSSAPMLMMCRPVPTHASDWSGRGKKSPRLPIPAHPLSAKGGNREGYNSGITVEMYAKTQLLYQVLLISAHYFNYFIPGNRIVTPFTSLNLISVWTKIKIKKYILYKSVALIRFQINAQEHKQPSNRLCSV